MWDQRYSATEYAYGTEPNDWLVSQYQHIPHGGKVICLAEGEGRNAVFLARQGYEVTAVDLSLVGLEKARLLALDFDVKITTVHADLARFDLGKSQWDGIVSIAAHVPPSTRSAIHRQIDTALTNQGVFILEAYTEKQLAMTGRGGPPATQKELFMSLEQLQVELSGLAMITGQEIERSIAEGPHHQGLSAVVQVIAGKR